MNTAKRPGGRPRYKISEDVIRDFERKRQSEKPPAPPRRRRKKDSDVTTFSGQVSAAEGVVLSRTPQQIEA